MLADLKYCHTSSSMTCAFQVFNLIMPYLWVVHPSAIQDNAKMSNVTKKIIDHLVRCCGIMLLMPWKPTSG